MPMTYCPTFSVSEAASQAGVSKNQLRDWDDKRLLPHVFRVSVGKHQHRRFCEVDIFVAKKIRVYQREGFILNLAARRAVADARKEFDLKD